MTKNTAKVVNEAADKGQRFNNVVHLVGQRAGVQFNAVAGRGSRELQIQG